MKAINFLTAVWNRNIEAGAYTILTNEPITPVTLETFGENTVPAFGEIPVGKMAAVYLDNEEGCDLINALRNDYGDAPVAMIVTSKCAVSLFSLE